MTHYVEVQQIVGSRVRDTAGKVAGRLESIRAEKIGPACVVHEFHLGTAAFLSRVGINTVRLFGFVPKPELLRVPWPQMDLSDPNQPCLRCSLDELRALQEKLPPLEDEAPPRRMLEKE